MHFHGIVSGSLQTHYNSKTKQKTQDETRWPFKYFKSALEKLHQVILNIFL